MKVLVISFILLFFTFSLASQEITFGNFSAMKKVKTKTSFIYENKDATKYYLTKKQLFHTNTKGINITIHSLNGEINRIITVSITKNGFLSSEWYFSNAKLIFSYQSFEYFDEIKNKSTWRNFKGNLGWESRFYFVDEKLTYHKHKGRKKREIYLSVNKVANDAKSVYNFCAKHIVKN